MYQRSLTVSVSYASDLTPLSRNLLNEYVVILSVRSSGELSKASHSSGVTIGIEIRENNFSNRHDDKDWCKDTSVALSNFPLQHMLLYTKLSIFLG